jgi:hypothetical protein
MLVRIIKSVFVGFAISMPLDNIFILEYLYYITKSEKLQVKEPHINQCIRTIIYPATDKARAKRQFRTLLGPGLQTLWEIKDVSSGSLVACVKDADGNIIGLIQDAG